MPLQLRQTDVEAFAWRLDQFDKSHAEHIVQQVPAEWLEAERRSALVDYLTARSSRGAAYLLKSYPDD